MKKVIFAIVLICSISTILKAQTKAKADTSKPKYNYFVTVPINDYQQIVNSLNEYKRLQMYDPTAKPEQQVQLFKGIEAYLKDLPNRVKLDSVKVTPKGGK